MASFSQEWKREVGEFMEREMTREERHGEMQCCWLCRGGRGGISWVYWGSGEWPSAVRQQGDGSLRYSTTRNQILLIISLNDKKKWILPWSLKKKEACRHSDFWPLSRDPTEPTTLLTYKNYEIINLCCFKYG